MLEKVLKDSRTYQNAHLLEIQKFYELFLQRDVKPEDRDEIGLQAVQKVFPIRDFSEKLNYNL